MTSSECFSGSVCTDARGDSPGHAGLHRGAARALRAGGGDLRRRIRGVNVHIRRESKDESVCESVCVMIDVG